MVSPAYEVLRVLLYMICENSPNWDEFYCIYRVKDSTVYAVIEPFRLFQQNYSALPLCPSFS